MFLNDHFEGFGVYQWPDGRKYEGEWKDNKMNGNNIIFYIFDKEMEKLNGLMDDRI